MPLIVTNANIELGAGYLKVKQTSPTVGTNTDVGACSGANLEVKKTRKEVQCDQVMAPLFDAIVGEEGSFKIKLLEHNMFNLAMAMGLNPDTAPGTAASYNYLTFGGETTPVYFYGMYYVPSQADATKLWTYEFYKMECVGGLAMPFSKGEERSYEVEFKLVGDVNNSYALGQIRKQI
jgi:hypothetical protein